MQDQQRWNSYGTRLREELEAHPEKYLIQKWPMPPGSEYLEKYLLEEKLSGLHVLDLGCGVGKLSVWLAKQGARVTAVDLGPDLVDAARLLAEHNGLSIETAVCDLRSLPFAPASYDLIVGRSVLHHLTEADVREAVRSLATLLKPGGAFMAYEPIEDSALFDLMQNIVPRYPVGHRYHRPSILQRDAWKAYSAQQDDRPMTSRELRALDSLFASAHHEYSGLTVRLSSVIRRRGLEKELLRRDEQLLAALPPLRRYARNLTSVYRA